jgi:DNA-binding HxlR family transcriptional regulator
MKKPNKSALRQSLPKRRSACPISYSLDFMGDKWTLLVVRDLLFKGKRHYGEFLKSEEAIATNILADRLLMLEAGGIIRKSPDPDSGVRYVYSLTDKGLDLIPVMLELAVWGATHDARTAAPRAFIRRYRSNREGLIKELRQSHVKA